MSLKRSFYYFERNLFMSCLQKVIIVLRSPFLFNTFKFLVDWSFGSLAISLAIQLLVHPSKRGRPSVRSTHQGGDKYRKASSSLCL